jgi:hypothetical protein
MRLQSAHGRRTRGPRHGNCGIRSSLWCTDSFGRYRQSSEFGENGVCGFGPQKGFCGVVLADIGGDGVLEIGNGFEDAAPDAPAGDGREEALDGIEPGRGRWREVKDPSWVVGQPGAHLWVLVGGIVVEDGHG